MSNCPDYTAVSQNAIISEMGEKKYYNYAFQVGVLLFKQGERFFSFSFRVESREVSRTIEDKKKKKRKKRRFVEA